MNHYQGETFAGIYDQIRLDLLSANDASPRGMTTKELSPVSFELTDPTSRLFYHSKRKFNLMFAIAESIQLFSPSPSVKPFLPFNSKLLEFSDDGKTLHGSYGARISRHIEHVCQKLMYDSESRQAVLTIHRADDLSAKTKDTPCTIAIQFLVRNYKLNCHVYMRSNDLYWGTPYDVFNFTMLQEVVANELGLELGSYFHTATSLHVYERHFNWLEEIVNPAPIEFRVPKYSLAGMRDLVGVLEGMFLKQIAYPQFIIEALSPFSDFLDREYRHQRGQSLEQLTPDLYWAYPFFKRWYNQEKAS